MYGKLLIVIAATIVGIVLALGINYLIAWGVLWSLVGLGIIGSYTSGMIWAGSVLITMACLILKT